MPVPFGLQKYVPFEEYDFNLALRAIAECQLEGSDVNREYEKGNHWQDGNGWSGPQFKGIATPMSQLLKEGIRRDFTSKGTSRSVVRRHRRGVLGREPGWIISTKRRLGKVKDDVGKEVDEVPTDDEKLRICEADMVCRLFWDQQRALKPFRKATTNSLTSARGPLRLFIPPKGGKPGETISLPTNLKIEEAIKRIFLLDAPPDRCAVVTDMLTMKRAGLYLYTESAKQFIEMCYVDDDGMTVVRTLEQGTASSLGEPAPPLMARLMTALTGADKKKPEGLKLKIGGKLLIFQIETEPLLTEQVRQNQALLDKDMTMLSHNLDLSGFRERIYRNAQPPKGTMVDDSSAEGGKRFVPDDLPVGAAAQQFVQGTLITETDRGGTIRRSLSEPKVDIVDPVPIKTYEDTERIALRNILEDTDQVHILISGDATVSGESRKQARDDYSKGLEETKSEIDYVGSEVMETVLAVVAIMIGKPGRYADLKLSFNAQLDPGPLSSQDRELNIKEKDAKIKSTEAAMEYIGTNDPDAMKDKIIEEDEKLQPLQAAQTARARIGLAVDKTAAEADAGLRERIDKGAGGAGAGGVGAGGAA